MYFIQGFAIKERAVRDSCSRDVLFWYLCTKEDLLHVQGLIRNFKLMVTERGKTLWTFVFRSALQPWKAIIYMRWIHLIISLTVVAKFPRASFLFLIRASAHETDGQKAGANGHHAGGPEAAHPAAGPAASCPGGSQDSSTSHTRFVFQHRA